jgi:ferritin
LAALLTVLKTQRTHAAAFNSAPLNKWESAVHVMEDVVRLEVETTKNIHELVDLALQEKDHATFGMLFERTYRSSMISLLD